MYQEEFEAVKSLYCLPGECEFQDDRLTVKTQVECDGSTGIAVQLVFQLPADYPTSVPQISILSEHLNRDLVNKVKAESLNCCENLLGEPMLLSLITSIQEHIREALNDSDICIKCENELGANNIMESTTIWTSVLHIDHMRSTNKYCKTLERWASELSLNGLIVFLNKLILVILQGELTSIKDFIVRLKTVTVDVDSRGHSCKERMMSVLCEAHTHVMQISRFNGFERRQLESKEELKTLFIQAGLEELYNEHITRLQGGYI